MKLNLLNGIVKGMESVMEPEPTNFIEPEKDHGQGVFNIISLPVNEDHLAVGRAIGDLLKEGWSWVGIDKSTNDYKLVLRREWRS